MKRTGFPLVMLAGLAALAAAGAPVRADLAGDVRAVLRDKLLAKARVGVVVTRLGEAPGDDTEVLLGHNSAVPLIPASNLKLVTTAAALDTLGPDFRFRTKLFSHGGDLVLVGDGDPTFGDAELLKKVGWTSLTVLERWADPDRLRALGIASVNDVVVDDSVFDDAFVHPHWPADQLHKRYVAGVAGVNLNANCLDFLIRSNGPGALVSYTMNPPAAAIEVRNTCVGGKNAVWLTRENGDATIILRGESAGADVPVSVTVLDPPLLAANVFRDVLVRGGTPVTGTARRDRATGTAGDAPPPPGYRLVAVHETPIAAVLAQANKDSMNLYAESLCKRLGRAATGGAEGGSWANGTAAIGVYLTATGVPDEQFHIDDGCGLSKQNAITAAAITKVLAREFHGPNRQAYQNSLAVAGIDGTLDDRFKGSDLRGRVLGKSGYVNNVSCLSGYLNGKDGRWYAFSILMNGIPDGSNSSIKPLQERIVRAVDTNTSAVAATR